MTLFAAILIFILGNTIGSFLSVAIYRLPHNEKKILCGRSMCPNCKKQLKWKHLIPVLSWMFLRGKCAYCGKKISSHYMLLELLTGITFLAIFLNFNFLPSFEPVFNPSYLNYSFDVTIFEQFLFHIIISSFLIGIFFYDLMYQEIPDHFSLPAIALAIIGGLIFGTPTWQSMLIGAAVLGMFFLVQFVISKGKWIGGGDIRMGVLMGILLGWDMGLLALIVGYVVGAIYALWLLANRKANRKTAIALGPFLIIGTFAALFYGNQLLNFYLDILI